MARKLRHGSLVGLGAAALALALWLPGALDRWENTTWTWRVKHFARPSAATDSIRIILLDQESLDWGQMQNGWSWPWPREVYIPIIEFCRRGGARAIAFDVLYTEPSMYGVGDDEALGVAIGQGRDFVGALFLKSGQGGRTSWPPDLPAIPWQWTGVESLLAAPHVEAYQAPGAVFPIPEIGGPATVLANVSDQPDEDGVFRRASLLRLYDGRVVPSLGLAAYLLGHPRLQQPGALRVQKGGLALGDERVPIDDRGRAILRFVGPTGVHPTVSAAAVIQSELRLEAGEAPSLEPADFAGCTVFFGFSAPGLLDLRPTPLSRVAPGVEIHATVLDNLMTGDFLQEAPRGLVVLATLVLALLSVLLMVASRKAWQSVALLVVLLPLPALAGMAAYGRGFWWPVVVGEVAVALSAVGGLVLNYATEGRQRQFIKQAFKFYLSPHVIEQILRNPSQLTLGGERRELTILFSDLQGFTAISEKLDPQTLTALLNDYLSDMTDIVLQEGGTLDKYEGDAFIAFWNAPLDQPDHAVRACHAAWRCQQKLGERRREFQQRTGVELRMRIGLHTGEVIVGNMGSRQRFNYTVLGDAANLASRLEGANKAFGTFVMLSETTRSQAAGQIAVREVGLLRVVGRQTPVRVFELLGLAPEGATRSARDLPAAATGEKGPMTIPAADPSGEPATARFAEFARGLALCREGKLGEALAVFEGIPDDPVSQAYGRQCRKVLAATGPPWDAVWNLAEK